MPKIQSSTDMHFIALGYHCHILPGGFYVYDYIWSSMQNHPNLFTCSYKSHNRNSPVHAWRQYQGYAAEPMVLTNIFSIETRKLWMFPAFHPVFFNANWIDVLIVWCFTCCVSTCLNFQGMRMTSRTQRFSHDTVHRVNVGHWVVGQ